MIIMISVLLVLQIVLQIKYHQWNWYLRQNQSLSIGMDSTSQFYSLGHYTHTHTQGGSKVDMAVKYCTGCNTQHIVWVWMPVV